VTKRLLSGWLHAGQAIVLSVVLLLPQARAFAADPVTPAPPVTDSAAQPAVVAPSDPTTKEPFPLLLDGTLSAGGDLLEEETPHTGFFRLPTALDDWFAWKAQMRRDYGFSIGGSYMVLWQNYSSSRIGQFNAVGSKFTLNLGYDILNRNAPDALTFDMAVEDRRALGTQLPPLQAGIGAGSIVPTASTYGQFDLGITQAYIRQNLDNNRFQYTIGKIFAPNFVDAYPFFDDNRQFLSQAFSTSPTIASPLRGFGAVAAAYPTDGGLYVMPGMFTSNSDDTGSTIGDFFNTNEHFYMLEVGSSGLSGSGVPIHARGPMDANNIHLTGWYNDGTADGSVPKSHGVAFNVNQMVGEDIMWFLRAGWSEGWLVDRAVSAGFGWRPKEQFSDLFGFGLGWTHPSNVALESQYTAEAFYRFHVTSNFAITPDLQLQLHPSLNPTENSLWVFSIRGRLTF
jgi:porin